MNIIEASIFILWIGLIFAISIRYLIFSIVPYYYFYKFAYIKWQPKFLQHKLPSKDLIRFEIVYSLLSAAVIALVASVLIKLSLNGYAKIYFDINKHSMGYFALTTLALIIYWDIYYYFSHRLFHTDFLYKKFHHVHHKNTKPTPFAALTFHPVETLVSSSFFMGICFVMEVHIYSFMLFLLYMSTMNLVGHLGVEVMPRFLVRAKLYKVLNFVAHHNQHHQYFHCNYGILLNVFDRLFKTNHVNYDKHYENINLEQQRHNV